MYCTVHAEGLHVTHACDWIFNMDMICEHIHRLELRKSFKFWVAVACVLKTPFISYSRISYFGHACTVLYSHEPNRTVACDVGKPHSE